MRRTIQKLSRIGIKDCPEAGMGVHKWIFYAASSCNRAKLDAGIAVKLISNEMTRDPNPVSEVERAVHAAYHMTGDSLPLSRFPERDMECIKSLKKNGLSLEQLAEKSPLKNSHQCDVMSSLFKPKELVCVGAEVTCPQIIEMPNSPQEIDFTDKQFIVPSPMSALHGITKDGKKSTRSISNTGFRRWIVIECDFNHSDAIALGWQSTFDVCASVLSKMSEIRPLVLAVSSGSKSLHGWFPVLPGESEDLGKSQLWGFLALACKYGADSRMWPKCQWTRIPGGTRTVEYGGTKKRVKQTIIYFDQEKAKEYLK
jgi:hypothetical protein